MSGRVIDLLGKMSSRGMTKADILKLKQKALPKGSNKKGGMVAGKPEIKDLHVYQCTVCGNTIDADRALSTAALTCSRCGSKMKGLTIAETSKPTKK